ncbi:MAG: hypothetical protein K8S99_00130 [Planctomycetes bacterium]|nr:hypothetical protein [Planctomycetota bacterium]
MSVGIRRLAILSYRLKSTKQRQTVAAHPHNHDKNTHQSKMLPCDAPRHPAKQTHQQQIKRKPHRHLKQYIPVVHEFVLFLIKACVTARADDSGDDAE